MEENQPEDLLEKFRQSVEVAGFRLESTDQIFNMFTEGKVQQLKCDYSVPFGSHRLECLLDFKEETTSDISFFKCYMARLNKNPGVQNEAEAAADEFYFKVTGTVEDCHLGEAYNLLCGRPVLKFEPSGGNDYRGKWVTLDPNPGTGALRMQPHPQFDFHGLLKTLRAKEMDQDKTSLPLISSLLCGNITAATLVNGADITPGFVSIDALNERFVFYNAQKEIIPYEDLWERKETKEVKEGTLRLKPKVIKRVPHEKNKGINKSRKR